ncbi:hypothetical protein CRP01_30000 [Flavilitoribacter nigricans DSM 23189 = NBRC 102662]|uniref:Uncharacterized protein n=2 Tax=Flavilitoribacter TaxID=2762562 RepID=A0A2D0N352_FLAN2|nr:hypothetical protein CRP01_30000 [Flavilitoribacter nigricans DSM 23189 = NBRC 102662]
MLFEKLAREEPVRNFIEQFPHAYVSQNDFCEGTDCEQSLRDAGINMPVYSKEAAFMRALRQNIVIVEINTTAEVPYLKYRLEGEGKEPRTGTIFI